MATHVDELARSEIKALKEDLPPLMQAAMAGAIREVLADQEVTSKFWAQGYEQIQEHAVNRGTQWVGKRLMTALITAVVTAGFVWLVRSGAIK